MKKIFSFLLVSLFAVNLEAQSCTSTNVKELVRNGDFESGYLVESSDPSIHEFVEGGEFDFYSDYSFVGNIPNFAVSGCTYGIGDKYAVGKAENFSCLGSNFTNNFYWGISYGGDADFADHTATENGKGYALVVDPNTISTSVKSGGDPIVWEQKVVVTQNVSYTFSFWCARFSGNSITQLNLAVVPIQNGIAQEGSKSIIAAGTPNNGFQNWKQISGSWSSQTNDSVLIRIEIASGNATSSGNDVIIDDISFINSCSNVASKIGNHYYLDADTIELCSAGGAIEFQLLNQNGTSYTTGLDKHISWYAGENETQVLLDSIDNKSNPIFKTSGDFRVCVEDPVNDCAVNQSVYIKESLDLGLSDIVLCGEYTVNITTPVKLGSRSCDVPKWTYPSGDFVYAHAIETSEVGDYYVNVGRLGSYKCKSGAGFKITSNIPVAKEDTVEFCTSAPDNIFVESLNGEEFIWAYDSAMTDVIDTIAAFWLPEAEEDAFDVYFKRVESSTQLGVLSNDTSTHNSVGVVTNDIFEILTDNIILEEAFIKFASWEVGCSGLGSTFDSYIVFDGPTYDSIPFVANCGFFTKLNLNVNLLQGEYTVRVKNNSNVYSSAGVFVNLDGFVTQKSYAGLGNEYSMLAKVKFGQENSCLPGRLYAKGKFCDTVTSIKEEKNEYLKVYPNPTTAIVYFNKTLENIGVYSIDGGKVKEFSGKSEIDLSGLEKGLYLIKSGTKVTTIVLK